MNKYTLGFDQLPLGVSQSNLAGEVEHFLRFFFERGATRRFAESARHYFLGDLFERRLGLVVRGVVKVHSYFLLPKRECCAALANARDRPIASVGLFRARSWLTRYTVAQQEVSHHEHKAFRFQGRIPLGI